MFSDVYTGKRVLVTGHTGFKGSWLTSWLLDLGSEVAGFANGIPNNPSHFYELNLISRIKNYEGDIRNYESLKAAFDEFKPEIVFHLAAQALVRLSYEDPKTTFEVNMLGTLNVLECIRQLNNTVKAGIIITSDKCYDNVEWIYGYRENDKLGGDDPYSGSKGAAELIAKSYIKSWFAGSAYPRIATARAGNVIGGGDWAKDRIVPDIVRAWAQNRPVIIRNPESTRPWQHVLEPLSGYLCLGADLYRSKKNNGEPFNFGPDSAVTKTVASVIDQMALSWKDAPGYECQNTDKKGKEAKLLKLCCDKANIALNWYPILDFAATISFTAQWYSDFYHKRATAFELTETQIKEYVAKAARKKLQWAQP